MSEPQEIPLPASVPLWVQRTTLDEREYLFRFDWNARENRWYMSLSTIDGVEVCRGVKVLANWSMLRRYRWNPATPKGLLVAQDFSPADGEPPVFHDLGQRVKLLYFPPDEQATEVESVKLGRFTVVAIPKLNRQDFSVGGAKKKVKKT